jgi:beta-galactosidase
VAALPLLELVGDMTPGEEQQAANLVFSLNGNWLFGGQYMAGSESGYYDDSGFAPVTLPHTVSSLSWADWDANTWQQIWIYRRRFNGARLLGARHPGNRIVVDFDGVMVNATVVINDQAVSTHQGGYLPWSAELTGKVTAGDNLLAVIVDARNLPVPPIGVGRGPGSIDFFQPGGIYRDVRVRVLPQVYLSDMFALPVNVLSSQRRVDVECTIDSALATETQGTLVVQLFDGATQVAATAAMMNVTPGGITTAKASLTDLGSIDLWSPGSPRLYTVQATLSVPGAGRIYKMKK